MRRRTYYWSPPPTPSKTSVKIFVGRDSYYYTQEPGDNFEGGVFINLPQDSKFELNLGNNYIIHDGNRYTTQYSIPNGYGWGFPKSHNTSDWSGNWIIEKVSIKDGVNSINWNDCIITIENNNGSASYEISDDGTKLKFEFSIQ